MGDIGGAAAHALLVPACPLLVTYQISDALFMNCLKVGLHDNYIVQEGTSIFMFL